LVPCDLCDHSQISHVVSNDVRSDILLTTLHVITDLPISDHMIGTLHRGPERRLVFHCGHRIELAQFKMAGTVYERQPAPGLPPSGHLYTAAGWQVV
ncbi:unnamed protein product, partial [Staurois parvus]